MPHPHPLLEQQRIDSAGDALCKERDALPERAALAENQVILARLGAERAATGERLIAVAQQERRIEGEVAELREQAREVETTLYSGTVSSVSELEALQAKLASLREHQARLEEEEMGILEQQEALECESTELDQQSAKIDEQNLTLEKKLERSEARIDGLLELVAPEREAQLSKLPAPVRAAYEHLRSTPRLHGLAAVPLEKDFCGACRTSLPVTHVSRIRAAGPDEVVTCQNCQRLVVVPDVPD